ncbi:unnamed protein product [Ixodes pacificus]
MSVCADFPFPMKASPHILHNATSVLLVGVENGADVAPYYRRCINAAPSVDLMLRRMCEPGLKESLHFT